ncbi:flagellin [Nitrosomonas halophila]|uniref:Flagellin n=1 Tax=Nitrosomonas halophila TaxID=44576 RepID=A0A1H3PQ43_9PROT|nr:flagellin [Nitrosomonas halophila]SDZ03324.1 flagellin [Nitrosomonas halophila]
MAQVINTNIASLNAQRNLNNSQNALNTALERLSTGLRINSAKDDAAGLAISERMTAQIRGLNQAARNANDGISLAQTAEGALQEIGNNLQRVRELAVQSANATNSASDRAALQAEAAQLIAEISRVADNTQFNGLNLLNGSFASQSFQIGANANQTINVASIGDARATALGQHTLQTGGSIMDSVVTATAATVDNGITGGALELTTGKGTVSGINYAANVGADVIAANINAAASGIGITATASNSATLELSAGGTIEFDLNGEAVSVTVVNENDLSALAAAINGVSSTSGVTASFADPSDKSSLVLSTTDGRDIAIEDLDFGANTINFNGTPSIPTGDSAVKVGTIELTSTQGQITAIAPDTQIFAATTSVSSFDSVSQLDLSNSDNAQSALSILDAALSQINSSRGDLGALQNRFSSIIASLQTTSENLSASRSRILDADFAAETANMTRGQIMQQAGVAILAQANALPNNVLSLLR